MNATIPTVPVPSFAAGFTTPGEVGPPRSFLLYGPTGTRKTSSVGRAIADGFYKRALWLDTDNGTEVFVNDPDTHAAVTDGRISILPIDPFADDAKDKIESAILEVCGMWRTPQGTIAPNPNIPDFGYDLVVIDTFSIVHEIALKYFQRTTFSEKTGKPDGLGAYAKVAQWDDEMVRVLHNSKRVTAAFLLHPKEEEGKTGVSMVKPKLSGSFKDSLTSIPSFSLYLSWQTPPEGEKPVLTAITGESDLFDSKNRYTLPSVIHDFDLSKLLGSIPNNRSNPNPAANAA